MPSPLARSLAVLVVAVTLLFAAPAAAQAYWGAVAVDPVTGATGLSYTQGSAHAAQARARNDCGQPHCKVAVWVFNGYGAVVQKKNGIFIAGLGRTKHLAFQAARHRAHEQSARGIAWVFSGLS